MKKLVPALLVTLAACATPVLAADVGLTISVGEPGFYGELNIGDFGRPRLINAEPVLVERRYRNLAPVYLRVPPGHARDWRRYCDRYNACSRPVYFVRDDWYRDVYVPKYREIHGQGGERREEHRRGKDHGRGRDRDRD